MVETDYTNLSWIGHQFFACSQRQELEKVLADYKDVINDELGILHSVTVKLHIDPQSVQTFCKASLILFSLKKEVESELQ